MSAPTVTKEGLVASFLAALEAGHVVVATEGSLLFDDETGRAIEAVIDDARNNTLHLTLWTDDDNCNPVELATVRVTAEVTS